MHRYDAAYITKLATRVFGDREDAAAWLDRANVQLGGRSPREVLGTEEGARRVAELLTQIDDDVRLHSGGVTGRR
jgi:putative toxin-antitoxin system antitoxin component (TIGR02293 family)